jgi:hypothetical protein
VHSRKPFFDVFSDLDAVFIENPVDGKEIVVLKLALLLPANSTEIK